MQKQNIIEVELNIKTDCEQRCNLNSVLLWTERVLTASLHFHVSDLSKYLTRLQ